MRARVFIATPAPPGSRLGNRVTALRWQRILRELGCLVRVGQGWRTTDRCNLLVALHATKSWNSIRAFRAHHPLLPVVVALTGTDLYGDKDARTRASVRAASSLVVLQSEALRSLDPASRRNATVILQSAIPQRARIQHHRLGLRVVALAHLRAIKNPLLAAQAARLLPSNSRIRIEHYGSSLDARLTTKARRESRLNPHWRWRGERSHAGVLKILTRSDVFLQTSFAEGGSSAMAEALACGLPILSTRNPGAIGMLGRTHPGFFEVDDAPALADLLMRCDRDPAFLRVLRNASKLRAKLVTPERERKAWFSLLRELGLQARAPLTARKPRA